MTTLTVLVAALKRHPSHLPLGVWAALLLVFGLASGALGWFGWRHVDRVVPSSLPEAMQRQRSTVVRRGAAFFFVVGMVLIIMGIYTATI